METVTLFIVLICLAIFAPLMADLIAYRIKTRRTNSPASYNALFDGPDLELGLAPANPSPCLFLHPFEGDDELDIHHHSLNGCLFCRKQLRSDKNVFFYNDMRFCSEECRIERIEIDDAKEKEGMKNKKRGNGKWFSSLLV